MLTHYNMLLPSVNIPQVFHFIAGPGVEDYRFQCPACSASRGGRIPVRGVHLRPPVRQPVAKARWF